MRYFLLLFFTLFLRLGLSSKVTVYFNYNVFNTLKSKPYLETYLTISGNSVKYSPVNAGYQAGVTINWTIKKGSEIIKSTKYNLKSPLVKDSMSFPSFIDNQRFSLDNGEYILELLVTDNAYPDKITRHEEKINIQLNRDKKVLSSEIQVLDNYFKTSEPGIFTKNGYDLIPYTINYLPKTYQSLKFYFETYNLDTVIGNKAKFVYSFYIENSENSAKQQSLSGFQKQSAQTINPLLTQLDISKLPSGNYNLVVEVRDSVNTIQLQKKWFFQRMSDVRTNLDIVETDQKIQLSRIEDFFNQYQSKDSLKQFIECLWPISTIKEREWQQAQVVKKDPVLMRNYLNEYWTKAAGDSLDPLKIWLKYYDAVLEADVMMKCGKQRGFFTDRGRVYLQYGKPDQRNQVTSEPNTYPYEIWQYYRIFDKSTGRFFSNKKFVFVNNNIADDCFKLIHSDLRGEVYDEKWRFRLVNRSQQTQNVDDVNPMKTYGNNIDENFNNPR
jgi:GWxTD domain-containing protein